MKASIPRRREFLLNLTFDHRGFPLHRGHVAGVNSYYRLYPGVSERRRARAAISGYIRATTAPGFSKFQRCSRRQVGGCPRHPR